MNSVILLSSQRSGSTFLDFKLNGLCGLERHGGEIVYEDFFIKNKIEHLINCNEQQFDPKRCVRLQAPEKYSKDCFYTANLSTVEELVENSKNVVFNIQLNQINFDISLIKKIRTPIIFLIRKNQLKRGISKYMMINDLQDSHVFKKPNESKKIKINKSVLERICKEDNEYIKKFQRELISQKNVKIIYYEDVQLRSSWTDELINELEDFMQIKFTNRNYIPRLKRTRNFVEIINEEEINTEEMIKKYYIKEI
jgi:hypothetical protein